MAEPTKDFSQPALWRAFARTVAEMETLVWNDPLIQDELTRAEGVRYLRNV